MHKILTLLLLLTAAISCNHAEAESNSLFFDRSQMTSPRYTSFTQDNKGYLWIGTSYGLMRFDGNNFKPYLHNEDIQR
jgi:ligand-binding sensor domain-containing protein